VTVALHKTMSLRSKNVSSVGHRNSALVLEVLGQRRHLKRDVEWQAAVLWPYCRRSNHVRLILNSRIDSMSCWCGIR